MRNSRATGAAPGWTWNDRSHRPETNLARRESASPGGPGVLAVSEPLVDVRDLVFRYGATEVLHSISFRLNKGEIIGLLGPNGAGKSTTIKIIAGIISQTSGHVAVCGLSLPQSALAVKERIGYVPEAAGLFESLSGQEFLELSGRLHDVEEGTLQSRIASVLERFDLTKDRLRRLEAYSKGMRQKILIGAALLHNPQLILLDEPLTGLDVDAQILVKDLIAALAKDGRTILYSSHILEVVERICDRVLIIHNGDLVADASVQELRDSTRQSNLEDVFRQLTHKDGAADSDMAGIIEKLRS
jgi:ABC-2 type transport system ATP-binding protein